VGMGKKTTLLPHFSTTRCGEIVADRLSAS